MKAEYRIHPFEVGVECGGRKHRIAYKNGKIILLNHIPEDMSRKNVLDCLSEGVRGPRCIDILQLWKNVMQGVVTSSNGLPPTFRRLARLLKYRRKVRETLFNDKIPYQYRMKAARSKSERMERIYGLSLYRWHRDYNSKFSHNVIAYQFQPRLFLRVEQMVPNVSYWFYPDSQSLTVVVEIYGFGKNIYETLTTLGPIVGNGMLVYSSRESSTQWLVQAVPLPIIPSPEEKTHVTPIQTAMVTKGREGFMLAWRPDLDFRLTRIANEDRKQPRNRPWD